MKRCIMFIFISLLMNNILANKELDSLFRTLDKAIAQSSMYMEIKEARMNEYKEMLNLPDISVENAYEINLSLYWEYKPYICDSALFYAKRCVSLAEEANNKLWIYESYLNLSSIYSLSLRFIEAKDLLRAVPTNNLPDWLQLKYYEVYRQFYEYYSWDFYEQYAMFRDSVLLLYEPESNGYKLTNASILIERGRMDEGLEILMEMIENVNEDTHWRAILAYNVGYAYRLKNNADMQKKYFAISAIADVKNAVKENASLHALARICNETGDTKLAYRYIHKSLEDAMFSNVRLRTTEISQAFPIIELTYREQLRTQKNRLIFSLTFISLLLFFLIIAVIYVYRQMHILNKARKSLSEANSKLNTLNHNLQETNRKMEEVNNNLLESNRLKEEYLGRYLDQCSGYIDKLENFRKHMERITTVGRVEDLYTFIKSKQFLESELKDFYDDFDNSFLQLFPNFIEEFNALLTEEEKIIPKFKESLNTELRIFALIRLGITDSTKIAQFLRYPVNTIFNYRTKVRNKATGNRDSFEANVMKIGMIAVNG